MVFLIALECLEGTFKHIKNASLKEKLQTQEASYTS
jgi:hypothetical protein